YFVHLTSKYRVGSGSNRIVTWIDKAWSQCSYFNNFYFSVSLSFMKMSERALKWIMRFYPPLMFQRIWVKEFHPEFKGVDVIVLHSLLNRNYNSSIFGGTIFSAADPFYPILFDQIF